MLTRRRALAWPLLAASTQARAGAGEASYTVVTIETREQRLQMFHADAAGRPYASLGALAAALAATGRKLTFAMNAGMYRPDLSPVGLLVENGELRSPLQLNHGEGNFFLLPNGVFCLDASGPHVVESTAFAALPGRVVQASQSGPLLLQGGRIHPAFRAGSPSRLIRNGVGVRGSEALFVISERPVNFHEMAVHFRDVLGCRDALYFDGVVSSLYSTALRRNDARARLGPIVGVAV